MADKLYDEQHGEPIAELTFTLVLHEYISDAARDTLHKWLDFLLERNRSEFSGIFVVDKDGEGNGEITHV